MNSQRTVEVKPEVSFLFDLLAEISTGRIQIPRFQRDFVWRKDQMTDLLDSIHKQYPIGSLLVWETADDISTLDSLGPFETNLPARELRGYLLDGHQRLTTLASALVKSDAHLHRDDPDDSIWRLYWNVTERQFQHKNKRRPDEILFPLTALFDTIDFMDEIANLRARFRPDFDAAVHDLTLLVRTFQSYKVPVVRIRQTELSEAVEIFARLNSKGQSMTADEMVSALTFRQSGSVGSFSLAERIDELSTQLALVDFPDIDRTTVLRALLAILDENIYSTDWVQRIGSRRHDLPDRLSDASARCEKSLDLAIRFLKGEGVVVGRLLPYQLQLVILSAFFDRCPTPNETQLGILRRWFWASSFSAWFGGANPARTSALLREIRDELSTSSATTLRNFNLDEEALPLPRNFDMRSARTRAHILALLHHGLVDEGGDYTAHAIASLSANGPSVVGHIFHRPPRDVVGSPANRLFRPRGNSTGHLSAWLLHCARREDILHHAQVSPEAFSAIRAGDVVGFVREREASLRALEVDFQAAQGVRPSSGTADPTSASGAIIDTD